MMFANKEVGTDKSFLEQVDKQCSSASNPCAAFYSKPNLSKNRAAIPSEFAIKHFAGTAILSTVLSTRTMTT
jgi:hypothetical protein